MHDMSYPFNKQHLFMFFYSPINCIKYSSTLLEEAGCPKKFITEKCVFLATIDKLNVQYDTIEGFKDEVYLEHLLPILFTPLFYV